MLKIKKTITESKVKFIKNIILNALGFALITGTVQLVLYPFLSRSMSQSEYGFVITLIGFANLFTAIFANSLVNSRLRQQEKYNQKDIKGDFSSLFYYGLIANVCFVILMSFLYNNEAGLLNIILVAIMSGLAHFRIYFSIHYKLHLNFKRLLIMSAICCVGYLLGMWIANLTGIWQISFLLGEFAGSVYVYFTSGSIKESLKKTQLFKTTSIIYLSLIGMQILFNIPIYADRLFIYPVLGADKVSIYFASVFFGRTMGAITTPIAGVIISYYSRQKNIAFKDFWTRNSYIFLLSLAFIVISYFLAQPITSFFYPTLVLQAVPYMSIANTAIIIFFASVMIYPAILKFTSIKWQLIIQIITVVCYFAASIILTKKNGLMGFCYAMLITNTLRLIMLLGLGSFSILKRNRKVI